MTRPDELECKWAVWTSFVGSAIVWLAIVWFVAGCVARSEVVDDLSKSHAETAKLLANVTDLHADLADEVKSLQAQTARKLSIMADVHAGNAIDLSNTSSGVNVAPLVQGALSGNWMEVLMGVVTVAAGGFAVQQRRKLTQANALTEEVADLEPVEARKVLKQRKPT